jgi:hypothetical protein
MAQSSKTENVKKLINFTKEEWDYIQNYKHANKLKTDTEAIKSFILNDKKRREDVIKSSIERHSGILKKLADR